jgi:rhodanese-related sulfurtransferase
MQNILVFIQQHLALSGAFAAILIALIILEFIKLRGGASGISPAQAVKLINHENAAIVDVRTHETFLTGHVVGAISLPLSELANKIKKIEKYKSQPLILMCASGTDSKQAASTLMKQGFRPLILAGGIRSWREAEMPLVKG